MATYFVLHTPCTILVEFVSSTTNVPQQLVDTCNILESMQICRILYTTPPVYMCAHSSWIQGPMSPCIQKTKHPYTTCYVDEL